MKNHLGPVCVLAGGTLWGVMGVFVRHFNAVGLQSMEICQIRMTSGLLIMGLYLLLFHRDLLRIRLKDLWCFICLGVGTLIFMNLCYFTAMQYTSLAVAGVLLYTAPIFVMLLSALLFREKITPKKVLALALAFFGCALVSGIGTDSQVSTLGLVYGLGSGFSYATYSIFSRFAIQRNYGSWTINFYAFLFCVLANSLLCDWNLVVSAVTDSSQLLWVVGIGLVTAFAPYVLYAKGLERMESSQASILASIEPVVAALVSVLIYAEPMSLGAAVGIGLVLAAIILLSVHLPQKRTVP